jgi:hypothetical protein
MTEATWTDDWEAVRRLLPADLEQSARALGAFARVRRVPSAEALLRIALLYSACDMSLRQTAAHALCLGLGDLSDVGVLDRLRKLAPWLEHVLFQCLDRAAEREDGPRVAVRIIDGSIVRELGPATAASCWRVHLGLSLLSNEMADVEIAQVSERGEKLSRHPVEAGEIVLADRGYCSCTQIASVLDREAHVVVRFHSTNVPLHRGEGEGVDCLELARTLEKPGQVGDWDLRFTHRRREYRVRLVAVRLTEEERARALEALRRRAQKKQKPPSERTLEAAAYFMVLTDLPVERLGPDRVLELYRLRWRVESYFKRLKSGLGLDRLRAHDPRLVRTYLLGKLIAAYLFEEWSDRWLPRFEPPHDHAAPASEPQPESFPPSVSAGRP